MFSGVRFALVGFNPIDGNTLRSKLVSGGGVDVGQYSQTCTHLIVDKIVYDDPICVAARSSGKVIVTKSWVDHSFDVGMLIDANSVLYRPLKDLNGIPGCKSLVACLTGYQRQDREDIMTMVDLMGGQFLKPLIANRVTHLICYKFEGEKYELAKRMKRIKLVNHRWLEDCLKNWKLLPEVDYNISGYELEIMEASARDSEDEAEDASAKRGNNSPLGLRVGDVAAVEMSKSGGKDITQGGSSFPYTSKGHWLSPKKTETPFEAMVSTNTDDCQQNNYERPYTVQGTSSHASPIKVADKSPEQGMSKVETDGSTPINKSIRRHSSLATYSRKTPQNLPETNTLGKVLSNQNGSLRMDDKGLKSTAFNISASKSGSSMERTALFKDIDKIEELHGKLSPPMLPPAKLIEGPVSSEGSHRVHHNGEASVPPLASSLLQESRQSSPKENLKPLPRITEPTADGEVGHNVPRSVLNTNLLCSNVVPMEYTISTAENIISICAPNELPERSLTEPMAGNILLPEARSGSPKQNLKVAPNISVEVAQKLDVSDPAARLLNSGVDSVEADIWTPENISMKAALDQVPERSVNEPVVSPGSGLVGMKDKQETELPKNKTAPRKSLGTRGRKKKPTNQKGSIYLKEPSLKDERTPITENGNQEISSSVLNTENVAETAKPIDSEIGALRRTDSVDDKSYASNEKDHLELDLIMKQDNLQAKTTEEGDAEVEITMVEPELNDVPTKEPSDGALQSVGDKNKRKRKREATVGGKKGSSSTTKVGKSSVMKMKKSRKEHDAKANDTVMKDLCDNSTEEKGNLALENRSGKVSSGGDQSPIAEEDNLQKIPEEADAEVKIAMVEPELNDVPTKDLSDSAIQFESDKNKSKGKREATVGGKKESSSTTKVGKSSVKKMKKSRKEHDAKANDTVMKDLCDNSTEEKENLALENKSGKVSCGGDQSPIAEEDNLQKIPEEADAELEIAMVPELNDVPTKDLSDGAIQSEGDKKKSKRKREATVGGKKESSSTTKVGKSSVKKMKKSRKEHDAKANDSVMKDVCNNSTEGKQNLALEKKSGKVSSGEQLQVDRNKGKPKKEATVEKTRLQSGKEGSSTVEVQKSSDQKTKKSKKERGANATIVVQKDVGDKSAEEKDNKSGKVGSGGDQSPVSGKSLTRTKVAKSANTGKKAEKESKQFSAKKTLASKKVSQDQEHEPRFFIISGPRSQRKEYQQIIKRLKGKCCRDSHQWSYQATHFIAPEMRRTEKFFAAAASGSWILKTDYVADSKEAGKLLPEEPYEWHSTGISADGSINLEAPRKWRLVREKTGHGALYGLRIVVYGDCTIPSLDTLKRVVKAGDGTILATAPPYTRFLNQNTDFALISPGIPRDDVWIQEFIRHEIPCVLSDYIVEYVCKSGYALDKHVLYNTNSWAERSFKKMQHDADVCIK